jgi:nucleoside-diphosphate-sugar epimerase
MTCRYVVTGGTGLLGTEIIRAIGTTHSTARITLPIRDQGEYTAGTRFTKYCESGIWGNPANLDWISVDAEYPRDTQIVIFCAFDVRFDQPVQSIIRSSVLPIVRGLERCRLLPSLSRIIVVSTAFVQPPLPYRRSDVLSFPEDVMGLYSQLIGKSSVEMPMSDIHPHTRINTYIFAKTLLEAIVRTSFTDLPITCVRPSIIACSSDGTRMGKHSPISACIHIHNKTPFGRCIPWWGGTDIVFSDEVAQRIVDVTDSRDNAKIVWCTNGVPVSNPILTHFTLPRRKFMLLLPPDCIQWGQRVEVFLARVWSGTRGETQLRKFYESCVYFTSNTWDFEMVHPHTVDDLSNAIGISATKTIPFVPSVSLRVRAYIELLRLPYHLNYVIVMLTARIDLVTSLLLYISFNIGLYGSIYTANAIWDREYDATIPSKKLRPIPSGRISIGGAVGWILILITISLSVLPWLPGGLLHLYIQFVLLNVVYTILSKHLPTDLRILLVGLTNILRVEMGLLIGRRSNPSGSLFYMVYSGICVIQYSKCRLQDKTPINTTCVALHSLVFGLACVFHDGLLDTFVALVGFCLLGLYPILTGSTTVWRLCGMLLT